MSDDLVDVIEVQIAAPHTIRLLATKKTPKNAEAIVNMAVMRRGCEHHFYTTAPTRLYRDGDVMKQRTAV